MTTARKLLLDALTECNKVQAPSLLLEDYNYLINKAISQYINMSYNVYDSSQQTSDNLRVLKATQPLKPYRIKQDLYGGFGSNYENIWEVELPPDYYHILNCMVTFKVNKKFDCYDEGSYPEFAARRLTSDMWSQIVNNVYMRPSYKRPYFFIHNVNTMTEDGRYELPTNQYNTEPINDDKFKSSLGQGTDPVVTTVTDKNGLVTLKLSGLSRKLNNYSDKNLVDDQIERLPGHRYGNKTAVRMEIRYGKDNSVFEPYMVRVDYLKTPQYIRLTQEQLDSTIDTSQVMEFPDYVCQEIVNGLVKLIMENASDPRLQTNMAVNQTIAPPAQQQGK